MRVPVCTKITPEQKAALQFLAHSQGKTPSKLISELIVNACNLDSSELQAKARSFFDDGARHVAQTASDSKQPVIA
jgi:hypothetical protein